MKNRIETLKTVILKQIAYTLDITFATKKKRKTFTMRMCVCMVYFSVRDHNVLSLCNLIV